MEFMNTENQFLQQDLHKAVKEIVCIMDCSVSLVVANKMEDYRGAAVAAEDMAKSYRELERLHNNKVEQENVLELVRRMKAAGINISLVPGWEGRK